MDSIKQRFLEVIAERGPVSDDTLAGELGDQVAESEAQPHTAWLAENGYVEASEFAPGRWQATNKGQEYLRGV